MAQVLLHQLVRGSGRTCICHSEYSLPPKFIPLLLCRRPKRTGSGKIYMVDLSMAMDLPISLSSITHTRTIHMLNSSNTTRPTPTPRTRIMALVRRLIY